ncbi:MAG: hypothetical protein E6J62_01540 [Deltaproteobacteria bacterium]|nr:MAG: hypothetical protein E6J62_01540 [Deltaproteobacteria bacterium]
MVVVELAGVEERPGEAVVLRAMVPVVLVGAQGMDPEAPVLPDVERQLVAMTEEDALAILADKQLGRQGAVEGPQREGPLVRQARVEARMETLRRVDAGIQARWNTRIVDRVYLGALRADFNRDLRRHRIELLVRPDRARGTPLDGARVTGRHAFQPSIQNLLGGIGFLCGRRVQYRGIKRIQPARQHVEARHRLCECLDAEQRAARQARRNTRIGIRAADEGVQAMFPEQQSTRREQAPLEQIAPRDLPVGERLDDLLAVPAGVLGFLDPKFRCFIGKKHQLLLFLIARLEPRRRSSYGLGK